MDQKKRDEYAAIQKEFPKGLLRELVECLAKSFQIDDMTGASLDEMKESPAELFQIVNKRISVVLKRQLDTFWDHMCINEDNKLEFRPHLQAIVDKNSLECQSPETTAQSIAVEHLKEKREVELEKIAKVDEQVEELKQNISESTELLETQMQQMNMH